MHVLRGAVSRNLVASMAVLAALALVMGLVAYKQVQTIWAVEAEMLVHADMRYLRAKVRIESLQLSDLTREYALQTSEEGKVRTRTQFAESQGRMGELLRQLVKDAHPDEQDMIARVQSAVNSYLDQAEALMAAYDKEGQYGPLSQAAMASLIAQRAPMLDSVTELENSATTRMDDANRSAQETVQAALRWVLGIGGIVLALAVFVSVVNVRNILIPLASIQRGVEAVASGQLDRPLEIHRRDEFGALAQAFNKMTGELRQLYSSLEQRVADRTTELERRSRYLGASTEVSRAVASILDADQLIRQVVELIRKEFDLYYVGLFLVDETGEWVVLRAGTGAAGQAMLTRGHRLKVGVGMIGWSVANAQARIALQAEEDAMRLATSELPDTRSEAALPLRSRGKVLGAFTVQSVQPGAFDEAVMAVLQVMADQVAVALDNARLFAESQSALEATRRAFGQVTREAWQALLRAQPDLGYRSDGRNVTSAKDVWRPEMEQAAREGRVVQGNGADQDAEKLPLAVPIKAGSSVIGVLSTHKPGGSGGWTPGEIALLEEIADQLALALDSARLYQDTQRRAMQEKLVGEVTTRVRETLDMETVLQTAVREMQQALGIAEVEVRLDIGQIQPSE